MNYRDVKFPDSVNGLGVMISIFVCGCHFHCKNCQNPDIWDPNAGQVFDDSVIDKIIEITEKRRPYIDGLSLLGGEPLEEYNQEGLAKLVKIYKDRFPEKKVWCWTGYNFEKDVFEKMYLNSSVTRSLLANVDYVIDGTFIEEKKLVNLLQRGSYNQRKFDVQASIKTGAPVLIKFGDEERYEKIEIVKTSITESEIKNSIFVEIPIFNANENEINDGQISFAEVDFKIAADSIDFVQKDINTKVVNNVENKEPALTANVENFLQ